MKNGNGHGKLEAKNGAKVVQLMEAPRTTEDVKNIMATLIAEVRNREVTPMEGNAMCNATGKLLKVIEMEYKYSRGKEKSRPKMLQLT